MATKKKATQPEVEAQNASSETSKETAKPAQTTPKTMADLLGNPDFVIRTPKKGETVSGKITDKTRKMLMIDIGGKTEGLVVDKEFDAARDYIDQLNVGDQVEAYILSSENDRGQILLSLKKAAMDTKWDEFTKAMDEGTVVDVKGLEVNKGGLIVVIDGIRGFIPTSQFGKEYVGNLQKLKNRKLSVKVIEVDKEKNRLIFSEKHVSEAAEMAQRAQALTNVKVGEVYEGVVSGVMPFGLFVTVSVPLNGEEAAGHIEGLVHISEMSWEKVNDPHELYKVGQHIEVKVLGVDEAAGKLNLSLKQLGTDPWVDIETRYPVGTTVTGTVSRVVQFGVFVKVEPGVDGLIHTSKLSPDQQFQPGEQVTVVVESVDPAQRRMSLSAVLTEVPMGYK
ncbi:S1 RNA-binding domain-containing protein [Patescibacteria group bacterium]|nr:S1 RNA-binding domain-containing protein [Patescibacteria group bacterium]